MSGTDSVRSGALSAGTPLDELIYPEAEGLRKSQPKRLLESITVPARSLLSGMCSSAERIKSAVTLSPHTAESIVR